MREITVEDAAYPKVELVGYTTFKLPIADLPWRIDHVDRTAMVAAADRAAGTGDGEDLAEFAGRACYQSWSKPNPETATNSGYLAHILEVGHYSVLEHASVTFYITGISRSLTHEFVRHRHFAYSQLSQRFVDSKNALIIVPPELKDDEEAWDIVSGLMEESLEAYNEIVRLMEARLTDVLDRTERRKRARQAARCVMPNMTETKIVVTGNYRAWMHFVHMRAAAPADHEIRRLAVEILRQLQGVAPNIFEHYKIYTLEDGTEAAEGPNA